MYRILTVLLSASALFTCHAQSFNNPAQRQTAHHRFLSALLEQQSSAAAVAMRTTSGVSMERLIAQSTRDNTLGSLNDSFNLKYNGGRGSTYDYNTMIYACNYPYNTSPMFSYAGTFTRPQVLADTLRHWAVDPNTLVYGYYETDIAGYDTWNNMVTYKALHVDSSTYPNMVYANVIPPNHNITAAYSSNWIAGAVDSAFKQYFTYNASNLLTADSTYELHLGTWRLASKSYYTYDGANNLIQIDNYTNNTDTSFLLPLVENLQYINTYDASHRLLTVQASYHYLAGLSPYVRDTFAYTAAYTCHTSWREYQFDTLNHYWAPMFNMSKKLSGAGLPDTVNIQGFDSLMNSWVPQTMYVVHYDTAKNPDTLKDFEYNFTYWPATPDFTTRYYYQSYLNTADAGNVNIKNSAKVYPNPAIDAFTITQLDVPANAPFSLLLIDAAGKMVIRESAHWQGEVQVSVNGLKQGIYWLVILDGSGNLLHRQALVKP